MNTGLCSFFLLSVAGMLTAIADVKLPAIISDHMVLQRSDNVPIWGTASPGESVTVQMGEQTVHAQADARGKWRVRLDLSKSGPGPFEVVVSGRNEIRISDVMVGQVWLASGQSNMEFVLKDTIDGDKEMARSANAQLREFHVQDHGSPVPLDDCQGEWKVAGPETAGGFSGVGYYFGKKLQQELQTPVGIVHSSWGATPVEAWTSRAALDTVPALKATTDRHIEEALTYDGARKQFETAFDGWLKARGREDHAGGVDADFTGSKVTAKQWVPVRLPGIVQGEGLPASGAIWLRREYEVSPEQTGHELVLDLGDISGFESVYWDGKRLGQTTLDNYQGCHWQRQYKVPANEVTAGTHLLAMRIFAPDGPPAFTLNPLQRVPGALQGDWLARAEYALPPLSEAERAQVPRAPVVPQIVRKLGSYNFNGMIHPLIPYAMRGVIWYQGEGNVTRAFQYRTAFPLLIADWRRQWGQGDFPFYFCQLANFQEKPAEPGDSDLAELREAQSFTQKTVPNTAQAVLVDIGEAKDIHPRNKKDAGERLARIALARDYGKPMFWSGPVYQAMTVEPGKIRLHFTHAENGLRALPLPDVYDVRTHDHTTAPLIRHSPKSDLEGFAICGADHKWTWAEARIDGTDVVVWSEAVPHPVAVRYGWADNPTCNLGNGAGLPASPFRTDDFPALTDNIIDW